ncbi:hypothetical protein PN36_11295 [Candidatus Thiomargarita nelsonii]|uniref:Secretin/TonB short N-terminal domain-containing protein n=1 Tax=Candidatus Thiomargarita nelsonii TaxID=1003181 RepID=A0A0A6PEM2_9GAMM|nr:hypothetical protein PN36_11295 [Candidatus Thiomargarita nelsonii]
MNGSNKTYLVFPMVVKWFICYSLLLLSNNAVAADGINQLEKMGFSAMSGNRIQVQLTFADTAITPLTFSTDNPARIVLEFPETKLKLRQKYKRIGIGAVDALRALESRDRTRVVLNLVRMVPFNINVVGNRVLVSLENMASQAASPTGTASMPASPAADRHIQDIDFRRTPDAAGRVVITLSEPSIMAEIRQEGSDLVIEFPNTRLPEQLDRRLDVLDFGTPISFIDTLSVGNNVRLNITVKDNYEYHAYQTENLYLVEVNKKVEIVTEELSIEERQYSGKLVSFNFQDIDVRAVLKLLLDLPGLNMIAGDEVAGSISLQLKNVPWDQALDIILEARELGMRRIGNVVIIDLKKNLDARKQRHLEAQKKIKALEPLHTEFIVINYAKAKELEKLLKTRDEHSFLSKGGSVSTDERTNTLIIQDTRSKMTEIRKLIASLDTPIRQVLIESKIVIATSNFNKDLGVKFGYSANKSLGNGYGAVLGGKVEGDTEFSGGTAFTMDNDTEGFLLSLPANAANPARVGLAIGKIGSYLLQLELSAMQSEGNGEVLSSPRLITGNQQEAFIMQGTQIPFLTIGGVGSTGTIVWKDATIELKVTPQITPDDRVNLELSVKKDAPGAEINGLASIDKREIKTNVLVNNGETIVLGGVYERTTTNGVNRVPFFSDIPLLGHLFKNRSNSDQKSELLIFVTPKILKENR